MGGSRFRRWWEAVTRGWALASVTNAAALALRLEVTFSLAAVPLVLCAGLFGPERNSKRARARRCGCRSCGIVRGARRSPWPPGNARRALSVGPRVGRWLLVGSRLWDGSSARKLPPMVTRRRSNNKSPAYARPLV